MSNFPKVVVGRGGISLTETAYRTLKEALLDGQYQAGQRLSIDEVARSIGSSRQPVMDSIRRLENEGLLTVVPQVGTMVTTVGDTEVKDFFHLLATTEGHFGKLAAQRASDAETAALLALVDSYPRAALRAPQSVPAPAAMPAGPSARPVASPAGPVLTSPGQDPVGMRNVVRRYRLHNRAFHGLIHEMARSPLVHQIAIGLWDKADFYINSLSVAPGFVARETDAIDEHRAIAQAIAARDGRAAEAAIVPHILAFADGFA